MSDAKTALEAMKYNELRALAKDNELDASGTKEDLVERLAEAGVGAAPAAPTTSADSENSDAPTNEASNEESQEEKPPVATAAESQLQRQADRELKTDAQKMKAHLDAQPKVSIMIPFEVGENRENEKKVKFHVNLNGYALDIPRGVYVDVPRQVAEIIKERLESEGKIGADWRIDQDPAKQEALG